jgi:hypothetical protein
MMKKFLLVLLITLLAIPVVAQESESQPTSEPESQPVITQKVNTFTRGKGFLARPELYGGFFLNGGYQFNPYVQATLGVGVTLDPVFITHAGVRVYTGVKKWAGMFDYHAGICNYSGITILRHSIVGGASYKDLDFGIGFQYVSAPNVGASGLGLLITIGWNIRFYEHR